MKRAGIWWHGGMGLIVLGLWYTAACDQVVPTDRPSSRNQEIIDDDDYDQLPSPTTLPTPSAMTPETMLDSPTPSDGTAPPGTSTPEIRCRVSGQLMVENSADIPPQVEVMRLAFYSGGQLNAQQQPQDINVYYKARDINLQGESFPINFEESLDLDQSFLGEAWIDSDQNGDQNQGDFLGYSSPIDTDRPCPLSVSWSLLRL